MASFASISSQRRGPTITRCHCRKGDSRYYMCATQYLAFQIILLNSSLKNNIELSKALDFCSYEYVAPSKAIYRMPRGIEAFRGGETVLTEIRFSVHIDLCPSIREFGGGTTVLTNRAYRSI